MTNRTLGVGYLLSLIGIYATGMLTFSYIYGLQLPCGDSAGCLDVALSPVAHVAGVPTPVFGLAFFAVLAAVTAWCLIDPRPHRSTVPYRLAVTGAVGSTGLTLYSTLVLGTACGWCVASNIVACLVALLFGFEHRTQARSVRRRWAVLGVPLAITVAATAWSARALWQHAQRFPWNPVALASMSFHELAPPDSMVLKPTEGEPTIVMFVDLECPVCRADFESVYRDAARSHAGLAIRNLPHRLHVGAYGLAVLGEAASQEGQGLPYIRGVLQNELDSPLVGRKLLLNLHVRPTAAELGVGRARVDRDRALARKLGVTRTPSFFATWPNRMAVGMGIDDVTALLAVNQRSPLPTGIRNQRPSGSLPALAGRGDLGRR